MYLEKREAFLERRTPYRCVRRHVSAPMERRQMSDAHVASCCSNKSLFDGHGGMLFASFEDAEVPVTFRSQSQFTMEDTKLRLSSCGGKTVQGGGGGPTVMNGETRQPQTLLNSNFG